MQISVIFLFLETLLLSNGQQSVNECVSSTCPLELGYLPVVSAASGQNTLNTTIVTAPIGSQLVLDCPAIDLCVKDYAGVSNGCEYKVEWHRLAGCRDSVVPPGIDPRLSTTGGLSHTISITDSQSQDSGLWACQLHVKLRSEQRSSAITLASYMLHIGDSSRDDRGMLECLREDGEKEKCGLGEICAAKSLSRKINSTGSISSPASPSGCVQMYSLPGEVIPYLIGNASHVCLMRAHTDTCEASAEDTTKESSALCCYCFDSACNANEVDVANGMWIINNDAVPSDTCLELDRLQARFTSQGRRLAELWESASTSVIPVDAEEVVENTIHDHDDSHENQVPQPEAEEKGKKDDAHGGERRTYSNVICVIFVIALWIVK